MTVYYERPVSRAAFLSRRLALFAVVMCLIGWALHRFGPMQTPSFLAIGAAASIVAALAVYLAVIGLAGLWRRGSKGGKAAAAALALSVVPLAPAGIATYSYATLPALYDVSSDLIDPPTWIVPPAVDQSWLGKRLPVTDTDREAQMLAHRGVTGRRYEGALDRVYTAARKVAVENGVTVTDERGAPDMALQELPDTEVDPDDGAAVTDSPDNVPVPVPRPDSTSEVAEGPLLAPGDALIQGEKRTLVFGLRHDVVIRLREEAETTLVDIRIASRYGSHDLGTGVLFIEQYLRALDAELLGIAGG